jgi:hypothetical protein
MTSPVGGSVLDWTDLCPQIIVWTPKTSRNQYGAPIFGASVTFQGRRVYKYSRVASYERGTKGQGPENISESQIWILGTPNVSYDDAVYVGSLMLWQPNTSYPQGSAIIDPTNRKQVVTQAGTSGATIPVFNDNGGQTVDNTVIWQDQGPVSASEQGDFSLWQPNTVYAVGNTIVDPALHQQIVVTAGTSGSVIPSFNDDGGNTDDNTVVWLDQGLAAFPPVLSVQNTPDEQGPLFVKIMLGSANG